MWKLSRSRHGDATAQGSAPPLRHRRPCVCRWIECTLLVFGLTLLTFYGAARLESRLRSRAALEQFIGMEKAGKANGGTGDAGSYSTHTFSDENPGVTDFSLWSSLRLKAYTRGTRKRSAMPLGLLRIPTIRLEVPVFDGTDELTLNHGVGHIAGTARPGEAGNVGIAGHRDGFFRGLKELKVGDGIELRTTKVTISYLVNRIQIVSPSQVEVLRPTSAPSLTLVTCYPFYFLGSAPERYIVTASLSTEKIGGSESSRLSAPEFGVNR
jgi:sortase A